MSLIHGDHVAVILSDAIGDVPTVGAGGEWLGEPGPGSPGEGVPNMVTSRLEKSRYAHED